MKRFLGIRSFTLFELAGIPVVINPTWFAIFLLLSATFFISVFPAFYPEGGTAVWLIQSIAFVLLFFSSLLIHEFSHSIVAVRSGIDVANITFHLFGGTARILKEPEKPADEARMAAAGPLTSFLISAISYLISGFFRRTAEPLSAVFFFLSVANLGIGFFNLLPAYPLDGGRLLRAFIWFVSKSRLKATILASRFSALISVLLFVSGIFYAFKISFDGLWISVLSVIIFFLSREGVEIAYQNEVLEKKLSEIIDLESLRLQALNHGILEETGFLPPLWIDAESRVYDVLKHLRTSGHPLVRIRLSDDTFYILTAQKLEDMIYEKLENARYLVK